MADNITELRGDTPNNNASIDALTSEQQHEWYLRIKRSLPELKKINDTSELDKAILAYEELHGLK